MRSPGYQLVLVDCDLIHVISAGFVLHETEDKVDAAPYLQDCDEVIIVKKIAKVRVVLLVFYYYGILLLPYTQKKKKKAPIFKVMLH